MNTALIIVVLYMLALLFCSWWVTQKKKSGSDASSFLMAGNQLTWPLVAVTTAGLAIGGASTVGVAENAYTAGLSAGWYVFAWGLSAITYGLFFSRKYRTAGFHTTNELVRKVYGGKLGFVTVFLQVLNNFGMLAMQVVAGGTILAALLPGVFTINQAMLVSTGIFLLVAVVGGLWAASLSNIVNMTVIYVGLLTAVVAAAILFGGPATITAALPASEHWFNPVSGMGPKAVMAWIFSLVFMGMCSQSMVHAGAAAKSDSQAKRGFVAAAIIMVPIGFVAPCIGIIAASQFPGLESAKLALPTVMMNLAPIIAGVALAGLWAADVSTATVMLVAQGSVLTNDIALKYVKKDMSDKGQIIFSRVVMVTLALLAFLMATTVKSILDVITMVMAMVSPLAMICLVTLHWPKVCRKSSALWIYLLGVPVFALMAFGVIPKVGGHTIYLTLLASLVGFLISLVVDKQHIDPTAFGEAFQVDANLQIPSATMKKEKHT